MAACGTLVEQGYDVTAFGMKTGRKIFPEMHCPWAEDVKRRQACVAVGLGIDFSSFDFQKI